MYIALIYMKQPLHYVANPLFFLFFTYVCISMLVWCIRRGGGNQQQQNNFRPVALELCRLRGLELNPDSATWVIPAAFPLCCATTGSVPVPGCMLLAPPPVFFRFTFWGWRVVVEPQSPQSQTSPSTVWVLGNKLSWSGLGDVFIDEITILLAFKLFKCHLGAHKMSQQVNVCYTAWQPEPGSLEPTWKKGGRREVGPDIWTLTSASMTLPDHTHPCNNIIFKNMTLL